MNEWITILFFDFGKYFFTENKNEYCMFNRILLNLNKLKFYSLSFRLYWFQLYYVCTQYLVLFWGTRKTPKTTSCWRDSNHVELYFVFMRTASSCVKHCVKQHYCLLRIICMSNTFYVKKVSLFHCKYKWLQAKRSEGAEGVLAEPREDSSICIIVNNA